MASFFVLVYRRFDDCQSNLCDGIGKYAIKKIAQSQPIYCLLSGLKLE